MVAERVVGERVRAARAQVARPCADDAFGARERGAVVPERLFGLPFLVEGDGQSAMGPAETFENVGIVAVTREQRLEDPDRLAVERQRVVRVGRHVIGHAPGLASRRILGVVDEVEQERCAHLEAVGEQQRGGSIPRNVPQQTAGELLRAVERCRCGAVAVAEALGLRQFEPGASDEFPRAEIVRFAPQGGLGLSQRTACARLWVSRFGGHLASPSAEPRRRSSRSGSRRTRRVLVCAGTTRPGGSPLGFRTCLAWV